MEMSDPVTLYDAICFGLACGAIFCAVWLFARAIVCAFQRGCK